MLISEIICLYIHLINIVNQILSFAIFILLWLLSINQLVFVSLQNILESNIIKKKVFM